MRSKRRYVPPDELKLSEVVAGQWVRASGYAQAHMIARNGSDAVCGRPCLPSLHEWVVLDDELAKCARCKGRDFS